MPTTMSANSRRITPQMLLLVGVVVLLLGYPLYVYVDSEISGGIKDAGGGYKEVDLKAMSLFDFDQIHGRQADVPQKWRDLDGKKIVCYGEMWVPNSASDELNQFDLCYSIAKCCFSGPPQVQHFVKSKPLGKDPLPYYSGLVKVKGVLHVKVQQGDGKVASVYQLDVENIEKVM